MYYRLTDNWIELSVRFLCRDHDIRSLKDRMSRYILDRFEEKGISIASGTYQIVGMPPLQVRVEYPLAPSGQRERAASDSIPFQQRS